MSSHLTGFNARNKSLTAKLLQHFEFVSKYNTGLKSLFQQGLSETEFYGDLLYKFRKIVGKQNFLINLKNIMWYKRIGYNVDVMRQSVCLVVNPVTVNSFAVFLNCMPAGRGSESMIVPI